MLVLFETVLLQLLLEVAELRQEARVRVDLRSRFPHDELSLVEIDSELMHDESNAEGAAA